MEDLQTFINIYIFISVVWGVLCLILFFKIWGMTNDVREIKSHLLHSQVLEQKIASPKPQEIILSRDRNIKKGDVVINLRNGKEIIVDEIMEDGSFICYIDQTYTGEFQPNEIATKEEYSEIKK